MIEEKLMANFAQGIITMSDIIERENPDILIYPLRGAVPIADFLRIVNPGISAFPSEYMPASSSISETDYLIKEWTKNAIEDYHVPGEDLKIITLDEIKSGQSVSRVMKRMKQAREAYRRDNNLQRNSGNIDIKSIGLLDLRHEKSGNKYQKPYLKLVENGVVIPVPINQNIVMDRPEFCPLELEINENDRPHYLPIMKQYVMSTGYLDLLRQFGTVVGQNLDSISLQNPDGIVKSQRFLPDKYKNMR
jgi:hypothetical protein